MSAVIERRQNIGRARVPTPAQIFDARFYEIISALLSVGGRLVRDQQRTTEALEDLALMNKLARGRGLYPSQREQLKVLNTTVQARGIK